MMCGGIFSNCVANNLLKKDTEVKILLKGTLFSFAFRRRMKIIQV